MLETPNSVRFLLRTPYFVSPSTFNIESSGSNFNMSPQNTLDTIQESVTKPTIEDATELDNENEDASHYKPKKRKKTSEVWLDFKEVTLAKGEIKAQCIHCKSLLKINKSSSTTHLKRHLDVCAGKKANQTAKGQQTLIITKSMSLSETVTSVQNFKYDHAKIREVLSHMIIVHELPFRFSEYELFNLLMRTATPHYEKISRATVRNDCMTSFELEKKKMMVELKDVKRMSVTTDLWKSDQNISYMVITGHYVDSYWNLQKRALNFCTIPPPHSGLAICDVLNKCLVEWGIEKKVWTITLDNATNNDVAIRTLKENLSYNRTLPLSGKIFHVRCCAHILNILVQDGLSAIQDIIFKVRESVKHVTALEMRTIMFSEIAKQLKLSSKKLVLDCCTRWNATYYMLSAALEFKDVFPRYQQRDALYTSLSSEEEWKKVKVVCSFLQEFQELTKLISGSEYPTANLFLPELVIIKKMLKEEPRETFMQEMIKMMNKKFDKYWGSCNLLLCIAAVLDPRNKMKVIKWCAKNTCSEVDGVVLVTTIRETLRTLYNEYVDNLKTNVVENLSEFHTEECFNSVPTENQPKSRSLFESYTSDDDSVTENSELDVYLEAPVVKWKEPIVFDAIEWWKMNSSKFGILSKMARDVLSIPITTVASESAFSAGGRVIDPHRASLRVDTVQMLLCTGDWLRARYEIKGKARDKESSIKEVDLN